MIVIKKAIIIGASSGIGRELAKILYNDGYIVGVTGRRVQLLNQLKVELNTKMYIRYMDISKVEESMKCLRQLIDDMEGVDLIVLSSGVGYINKELNWNKEQEIIDVNVLGTTAMINVAIKYFISKNIGHLVIISSIAAIRGNGDAPGYNASKAYLSNYVEGLLCKIKKNKYNIKITDVKPGLIDTDMAKGEGVFWVASPEKAANQIYNGIKSCKEEIYVTKRWSVIARILKIIPKKLYYKI